MFGVDTNILIYAVWQESPEHKKASSLVAQWIQSEEPWFITWNVAYEFFRVSTHAGIFDYPLTFQEALEFLMALVQRPNFSILREGSDHFEIVKQLVLKFPRVAANLVHDFHTAAILYENGIRKFYTADTDFLQFDFLEVIDPVH